MIMIIIVGILALTDVRSTEITDTSISEPTEIQEIIITEEKPSRSIDEYKQWWTNEDLDMLAAVIYYEAGSGECTDRHQQLVGQVVLNRMASDAFPDTVYDVITDTKHGIQYSTYKDVLANMGNRDIIPQRCYNNALAVLSGNTDCPADVIYQANFVQGSGVYEKICTSYSVSYFCYR
jgi:N-acetylmuramoyl-L-alanine amidase